MSDDLTIPRPGYARPRRHRYAGMDPTLRRMLIIAGSLAGGLMVIVGISSLFQRHGGEVPVVQADNRPIRVKPDNPGGLQVANAANEIFSGGSDTDVSKLAPPPEVPNPAALRAAERPTAAPAKAPAAEAKPAKTAAQEAPARLDAGSRPAAVARADAAAEPKAANAAVEAAAKPAAVARVEPAPDKRAATVSGKGAVVQLAALSSEEGARAEWQTLNRRMPELLQGRTPNFQRTEHQGHTFWRVRTAGFADLSQARAFCDKVRAKGAGCSVADF